MTLAARLNFLAAAIRDKINLMVPRLLPGGGTTGQVLSKTSATDYAVGWSSASGKLSGTVSLSVVDGTFEDTETFAVAGLLAGARVLVQLAPTLDSEENDPDFLAVAAISAACLVNGQLTISIIFSEPTGGPVKVIYGEV